VPLHGSGCGGLRKAGGVGLVGAGFHPQSARPGRGLLRFHAALGDVAVGADTHITD